MFRELLKYQFQSESEAVMFEAFLDVVEGASHTRLGNAVFFLFYTPESYVEFLKWNKEHDSSLYPPSRWDVLNIEDIIDNA